MRVNIIGNHKKTTGVSQDVFVLHGMLVHVFGKDIQVRHVPHYYPECGEAEVNFFIEVINPSLFMYAAKNIWIPNPEWTYKSWKPYLSMVDEVWVKTHEGMELLGGIYTGWTSIDKTMPEVKNFGKAIVPTGKNIWRNPRPIIQAYMGLQKKKPEVFAKLPELHVVHSPDAVPLPPLPESLTSKIILHSEVMSEESYDALMKECGLCICMSAAEGFGHAVNEAMSAGCILMLSPIDAFEELAPKDTLWVSELKRTLHSVMETCLMWMFVRLQKHWNSIQNSLTIAVHECHKPLVTCMNHAMQILFSE